MASKFPPFRPPLGLKYVLKANPYHDELGRFSTKNKAKFVSVGGVFTASNARDKGAYGGQTVPVGRPALKAAALAYSRTFSGGLTVAKASEHYIRAGEKGVREYFDEVLERSDIFTGKKNSYNPDSADDVEWATSLRGAGVLVDAIRESKLTDKTLFRGITVKGSSSELDGLKPGDSMELGRITSFSEEGARAAFYANGRGKDYTNYLVELRGKSRTVATDDLTGMGHKEHITVGSFKVVEVKKGPSIPLPEGYTGKTKFSKHIVIELGA